MRHGGPVGLSRHRNPCVRTLHHYAVQGHGHREHWLRPPPKLKGPPSPSTRMLRLLPGPGQWGCGLNPPKTPMAQSAACHSHSTPAPHTPPPTPPRCAPALPTPSAGRSGEWAVVSQFSGQTVPLATGTHPKDDAVQDSPRVGTSAPRGFCRVHFRNDRLNPLP